MIDHFPEYIAKLFRVVSNERFQGTCPALDICRALRGLIICIPHVFYLPMGPFQKLLESLHISIIKSKILVHGKEVAPGTQTRHIHLLSRFAILLHFEPLHCFFKSIDRFEHFFLFDKSVPHLGIILNHVTQTIIM